MYFKNICFFLLLLMVIAKPAQTKNCKNPKGKYRDTDCVDNEWQKCNKKGKWTPTGKACPIPPITLVEKAGPCLLVNIDCRSSTNINIITSTTTDSSHKCEQFCNDIIGCAFWTYEVKTNECFALTDCNRKKSNGFISGTPGCVPSEYKEVVKGDQISLVKDCFQEDKGFAGEPDSSINSSGAEHCAHQCLITPTCHCWSYDPITDQCHEYYKCPLVTDLVGRISGDRDCSSYREKFGFHESANTGQIFTIRNYFFNSGFDLSVRYTNSSCNGQADDVFSAAEFPNTEDCGPHVTVDALSVIGTPHFGCQATETFMFPDLYIKPATQASGFQGCAIDSKPFTPYATELLEIPSDNKFSIFVDRREAGASATVVWEKSLLCPSKTRDLIGSQLNRPITYFDYCGNYTISAETSFPISQAICTVQSDEYPIPDWTIVQEVNSQKCTITKSDGNFFIFVDSRRAIGTATVEWEECPTQNKFIKGNWINNPLPYYAFCGNYTISARTIYPNQANCTAVHSYEYPIPAWTIIQDVEARECTINKGNFGR